MRPGPLLATCTLCATAVAKVSLNLGICYDTWAELGAYGVMAKVALDEGYFDDVLPKNATKDTFTIAVTPVDARCSRLSGALLLPLLLGEGDQPGRIFSTTERVEPVVGIAGCSCTESSVSASAMATYFKVPMVSGAATNPDLSDKSEHPYFARVIPPDTMQGQALASLVIGFGWKRVFAFDNADAYSQGIVSAFKRLLPSDVTCMEYQFTSTVPDPGEAAGFPHEEWLKVATQVARESPQPRIMLFAGSYTAVPITTRLFKEVGLLTPATVWMTTEAACDINQLGTFSKVASEYQAANPNEPWWTYPWADTIPELVGMMCFLPEFIGARFSAPRFQAFFARLTQDKLEAAGWPSAEQGWQDEWLSIGNFGGLVYNPLTFDSVAAFIMAIGGMLARGFPVAAVRGEALMAEIFATQFEGITGPISFDTNGDRLAPYTVHNMRVVEGVLVLPAIGTYLSNPNRIIWTSQPVFADGTTNVPSDRPVPCSSGYVYDPTVRRCVPCDPGSFSFSTDMQCVPCSPGQFQDMPGQSACLLAPRGTFASRQGAQSAANCSAGSFSGDRGAVACSECQPGSFAAEEGLSACEVAPAGTFVASEGARAAVACALGTYGMHSGAVACEPCPAGSFQMHAGQTACDACPRDHYLADESCRPCGVLRGTRGPGETSADACKLTAAGIGVTVACAVGGSLFFSAILLLVAHMRRRMKLMAEERERQTQQTVESGLLTVREFGHPMVLVRLEDFLKLSFEHMGELHEGMRDSGQLVMLDTLEQVSEARKGGMSVIFFSYEWLSWERCGPNPLQFTWMKSAALRFVDLGRLKTRDVCVWLDVLAIPQCHLGIKKLAVNSLYTYATASDALIIIAPESRHENTGIPANLASYKSRIWTRAEQIAHLSCHDLSSLLIATPDGLEPVSESWLQDIVCIFEAEMTCCRLRHEGKTHCDKESLVLPMLGLWYTLTTAANRNALLPGQSQSGCMTLYKLMQPQLDRVFPPTFAFVTKQGHEKRTLFGDYIHRVDDLVMRQADIIKPFSPLPNSRRPSTPSLARLGRGRHIECL